MKKIQKKRGVTLLALAITIIIMLLLAGVVMQMALGDNGLFVRATKSKSEQAKAELYENAKLEYLGLKTKAIEQGQPDPQISEVLSAANFLAKYTVDGSNIKDKKGEVIDTRDNLLEKLDGMSSSDVPITPSAQTYPEQSYPKTIDGVTIQETDKDKLILKIKIKEQTKLAIRHNWYIPDPYNIQVEWGNWGYDLFKPDYSGPTGEHEYYPGEYTMKITGAKSFSLESAEWRTDKFEVTVLHWGKFEDNGNEDNKIRLYSVKDIKMPEPNDVTVEYQHGSITNIPEDLFKYKSTRKNMSSFQNCANIASVPENLYKYNIEMTSIQNSFLGCYNLTAVPEGLFKYNQKLNNINNMFSGTQIASIPENLFKFNKELETVSNIFTSSRITDIPENLFKYNVKLKNINGLFTSSHNIKSIPENLFKFNTEVTNFSNVFSSLPNLDSIPENIFSNNKKAITFNLAFMYNSKLKVIPENLFKNNTEAINFSGTFQGCSSITTIPGNLFDNNQEAVNFNNIFSSCNKLNNIPWNLFQNNTKATQFSGAFSGPNELNYLALPSRCYSLEEYQYRGIFAGCNNAWNYSSIPESWKNW